MDKVRKVHFCNFRGRMGDARKLLVFGAAVVLTAAATGLADVAEAQSAGGGVITAAQVFRQMLVQEEEAIAREAKERAEESEDMRRHRNRDGGSRPPQRLRDVPIEDWLATEEGRFAHSIRIPNPVPEDSGYRPGMSQQEYFEHLCKNEAGEFIFKTADNVEGLYQMRPRRIYTDQEWRHLFALEDPYGYWVGEWDEVGFQFVLPSLYSYFEIHPSGRRDYGVAHRVSKLRHESMFDVPALDVKVQ